MPRRSIIVTPPPNNSPVANQNQLAIALGCHAQTIARLVRAGVIAPVAGKFYPRDCYRAIQAYNAESAVKPHQGLPTGRAADTPADNTQADPANATHRPASPIGAANTPTDLPAPQTWYEEKLRLESHIKRLQVEVREGLLIPRADLEREWTAVVIIVTTQLGNIARDLFDELQAIANREAWIRHAQNKIDAALNRAHKAGLRAIATAANDKPTTSTT